MNRSLTIARTAAVALALAVSATLLSDGGAAAGDAKGTIAHRARTVTLAHAYLVTGPDGLDPKKTVRRIILSAKDLGAKVRACQTMSCADSELMEGLVIDIDGGPRLNYWMTVNNQLVQYSGTKPPAALRGRRPTSRSGWRASWPSTTPSRAGRRSTWSSTPLW